MRTLYVVDVALVFIIGISTQVASLSNMGTWKRLGTSRPIGSYYSTLSSSRSSRPSVGLRMVVANVTTSSLPTKPSEFSDQPRAFDTFAPNEDVLSLGEPVTTHSSGTRPSFARVLWEFTRPHTIIGSAMSIPSQHFLAAPTLAAALAPQTALAMVYAMIPSLLMNLYITGLNQITDVEIDKINKPYLPLAAGLLKMREALVVVSMALVASLGLGWWHPVLGTQGLNVALWGSFILGTLYSLPPFRLKRFPLLAAFCIVAVRGAIINAGFYAHALSAAFSQPASSVWHCLLLERRCQLSSAFFAVFGVVIALMKDVPDVVGDRVANILTFSVRIGQKRVFHATRQLLSWSFIAVGASFVQLAWSAPSALVTLSRIITATSAFVFAISVRREAFKVDPEDSKEVYAFYMHLWKLFYLSYLVLPFAR